MNTTSKLIAAIIVLVVAVALMARATTTYKDEPVKAREPEPVIEIARTMIRVPAGYVDLPPRKFFLREPINLDHDCETSGRRVWVEEFEIENRPFRVPEAVDAWFGPAAMKAPWDMHLPNAVTFREDQLPGTCAYRNLAIPTFAQIKRMYDLAPAAFFAPQCGHMMCWWFTPEGILLFDSGYVGEWMETPCGNQIFGPLESRGNFGTARCVRKVSGEKRVQ